MGTGKQVKVSSQVYKMVNLFFILLLACAVLHVQASASPPPPETVSCGDTQCNAKTHYCTRLTANFQKTCIPKMKSGKVCFAGRNYQCLSDKCMWKWSKFGFRCMKHFIYC